MLTISEFAAAVAALFYLNQSDDRSTNTLVAIVAIVGLAHAVTGLMP